MQKNRILKKIVKRNYNNELEKILEEKQFSENVKNNLLSLLYKIEAAYSDFELVKRGIQTKDEYIEYLFEIIKKDCKKIEIVNIGKSEGRIPDGKTYFINKEEKSIISYPIERKLLYAIAKIGNKDKIVKESYFIINETLTNLINIGNNISIVEPLRDFNGYSWITIPQEIENINYNLFYQNLLILADSKLMNKWIKNSQYIIDYYEKFKEKLEVEYGKENREQIINLLEEISILLEMSLNTEVKEKYNSQSQEIKQKLEEMQNKEKFISDVTKEKQSLERQIKERDEILSNKKLLEEEYLERNSNLKLEEKIFSIRILVQIIKKEKMEYLQKIEELNNVIRPRSFIKYRDELAEKYRYLKLFEVKDVDAKLEVLKLEFQKLFINIIQEKIEKASSKEAIIEFIYEIRYYMLLQYDSDRKIHEVAELQVEISKLLDKIIEKAINLGVIFKISAQNEINNKIIKNIFYSRIIKLENIYFKLTKEKQKYFLQLFDENIFEEKIQILNVEELLIKLNKKTHIFM